MNDIEAELPTTCKLTINSHKGAVCTLAYSGDGAYCLSGGRDRTVRLWNVSSGKEIKSYEGHGRELASIAVASDNSRFASAGGDRAVFLWDVTSGRTIRRISGHEYRVNAVKFNEEATVLVSGSYDTTVRCWDIRSSSRLPIQVLSDAKDSVTSVDVTQHEIISASVDGRIRVYDLRMGRLTDDTVGPPVTSVMTSQDGNCLLACSLDNAIRLFDKDNGELLNTFKGHKSSNYKIDGIFSVSDAYVISGSEDGQVYIWDIMAAVWHLLIMYNAIL